MRKLLTGLAVLAGYAAGRRFGIAGSGGAINAAIPLAIVSGSMAWLAIGPLEPDEESETCHESMVTYDERYQPPAWMIDSDPRPRHLRRGRL